MGECDVRISLLASATEDLLNEGRADLDSRPLGLWARGGGHVACDNE